MTWLKRAKVGLATGSGSSTPPYPSFGGKNAELPRWPLALPAQSATEVHQAPPCRYIPHEVADAAPGAARK